MYEVTCPHCEHVLTAPFVRVGAVIDCEACEKRFQIGHNHVRHIPPVVAANVNEQFETGAAAESAADGDEAAEALHAVAEAAASVGVGLRRAGTRMQGTVDPEDLPLDTLTEAPPRRVHSQLYLIWITVAAAVVIGVVFTVLAVWLLTGDTPTHRPVTTQVDGDDDGDNGLPDIPPRPIEDDPDAPVCLGREAPVTGWLSVTDIETPLKTSGPIQVTKLRWRRAEGYNAGAIEGEIRSRDGQVYAHAVIDFYLYHNATVKAKGTHTAYLICPRSPVSFVVPLPAWIGDVDDEVAWSVRTVHALPGAVALEPVECAPLMGEERFTVRLEGFNDSDVRMGRVAVAMELVDAGGVVQEQWTGDVPHNIWQQQWGEVVIELPARWGVADAVQGRMVGMREADDPLWRRWDEPTLVDPADDPDTPDSPRDDDDDDMASPDDPPDTNGDPNTPGPDGSSDDGANDTDSDETSGSGLFPWLPRDDDSDVHGAGTGRESDGAP